MKRIWHESRPSEGLDEVEKGFPPGGVPARYAIREELSDFVSRKTTNSNLCCGWSNGELVCVVSISAFAEKDKGH